MQNEYSLLGFALGEGLWDAARLLLEHGADPNVYEHETNIEEAQAQGGSEAEAIIALMR